MLQYVSANDNLSIRAIIFFGPVKLFIYINYGVHTEHDVNTPL